MKKMILIGLLSMMAIGLNAQSLLTEDFNYSGPLLSNGWSLHSGSTSPILTTDGLTYVGYPGSGIGNAANVTGSSDDVNIPLIDSVYTPGESVYLSALVNVTELVSPQTGGYFLHLGNRNSANSFSAFAARVFVKTTAAGVVNFGVSNASIGFYGATGFALNTTYLIIVKYTITLAPAANPTSIWVLPAGIPVSEAAAGTAEFSGDMAHSAKTDTIDAVGIRQSTNIPDVIVDGLRVSKSWSEAVGLPVELSSFTATKSAVGALLMWSTKTETNNAGWEIESRQLTTDNGQQKNSEFRKVGFVTGKGTTTEAQHYSFTSPITHNASQMQFRLKQIDTDGNFKYSSVETINVLSEKFELLGNYPNPFNPSTKISFTLPKDANVRVSVSNVLGQEISVLANREFKAGKSEVLFNSKQLTTGIYFYTIISEGLSVTKSMTLLK